MGLRIVIDEIGPREGLLDRGGIGIQLNPAGKLDTRRHGDHMAQFPAGSPAQASTGGQSPPVTERERENCLMMFTSPTIFAGD